MIRLLLIPLLAISLSAPAAQPSVSAEVTQAVTRFLTAFENIDMPTFIACFADDATVFFPAPEPADRFDGKPAIAQHFSKVFAAIRASASGGPPYHELQPQDLQVTLLGPHAALVTFHLRNSQRIARRTLVLVKVNDRWLIQHLHASNQPVAGS